MKRNGNAMQSNGRQGRDSRQLLPEELEGLLQLLALADTSADDDASEGREGRYSNRRKVCMDSTRYIEVPAFCIGSMHATRYVPTYLNNARRLGVGHRR